MHFIHQFITDLSEYFYIFCGDCLHLCGPHWHCFAVAKVFCVVSRVCYGGCSPVHPKSLLNDLGLSLFISFILLQVRSSLMIFFQLFKVSTADVNSISRAHILLTTRHFQTHCAAEI